MASPRLDVRLPERLRERVDQAAAADGLSVSQWVRKAILEKLGDEDAEARERAELLAEARAFLAIPPGNSTVDRDGYALISKYVAALESSAGRLSLAEQRGRARALAEIAAGALEPLDGEVLTFPAFSPGDPPPALEVTSPRRRGFLKAALAAERARTLLQAPPPPSPPPSAAGLLGEQRTRELWNQAISWPGWQRLFCAQHGIVPSSPDDPGRCYLGCATDNAEKP